MISAGLQMADITRWSGYTFLVLGFFFFQSQMLLADMADLRVGVKRELWQAVMGDQVYNLTSSNKYQYETADIVDTLEALDSPRDIGENYGQRLTTYFLAPQAGSYNFYLSCNLACQLWISTDYTPMKAELLIQIKPPGFSSYSNWQQSNTPVVLNEKSFYFIKVLMKEQNGSDFLSVGVDLPDGTEIKPITAAGYLYLDMPEQHKGSFTKSNDGFIPNEKDKIQSLAACNQLTCANYCIAEITCQYFGYDMVKHLCILYKKSHWSLGESDKNIQYYNKAM